MDIVSILASELDIRSEQVEAVIALSDEGNTVPFIARYRKEKTGGLDDQIIRKLVERLAYLRGQDKRREEIAAALEAQGVLDAELRAKLDAAVTMTELEDIYRPFRPKRRTRAIIARERGLEPLADWLMRLDPKADPEREAERYVSEEKGVPDTAHALDGARDIIAERISDDAVARKAMRAFMEREATLTAKAAKDEDSVYSMYYSYSEPVGRVAPHRILAVNRGEREGFLKVSVEMPEERAMSMLRRYAVRGEGPSAEQAKMACDDAWGRLLEPSLENELRNLLTDRANTQAASVFSDNLYQLLMQPPIHGKTTLGVDPGFRTGCKLAVVDASGKVLETGVGHFTLPGQTEAKQRSAAQIKGMVRRHGVTAIAIGNGTASRESEQFIASLLPELPGVSYMIVSEAGASVYSASENAAKEFPDFDVTLRSAVSIARRMQDPLAELVKIDPKAIGVGQYQHDLKQAELTRELDGVVERCVNMVGVEVSTASAELLAHVAGIGPALAKNIVAYRDENGLPSRAALKKVPKLGPKAYEQCAGFLRVKDSKNPLDATAVHPESYTQAEAILEKLGYTKHDLKNGGIPGIGQRAKEYGIGKLKSELDIGDMTLTDILSELQRPGRDPRDELPKPVLRTDVLSMEDLKPGMELTGTVRNVIDFGVFVDIGVHQDGLVHISRVTKRFIKHPSEVVKVGDIVKVRVLEVDLKKKRISLTMVW